MAILSVVCSHALYIAIDGRGFAMQLVDIGTRGVDLFFILSGFCLSFPFLKSRMESGSALPRMFPFLRRRLARIAPPYYVAIALFGSLGFVRGFRFPTWPGPLPNVASAFANMGLDAAFLTSWHPIDNVDFWTLGLEMRWYVLFPLVLALYARSRTAFVMLLAALYAAYVLPDAPVDFGTLPCFMLGIVAADLAVRGVSWRRYLWPLAGLTIAVACMREPAAIIPNHGNPLWHLAAFLFVVSVTGNPLLARAFALPWLTTVGVASYSIYLVHHPFLVALTIYHVPVVVATIVAVAIGFAFWWFVELPLLQPRIRQRIENVFQLPDRLRAGRDLAKIA